MDVRPPTAGPGDGPTVVCPETLPFPPPPFLPSSFHALTQSSAMPCSPAGPTVGFGERPTTTVGSGDPAAHVRPPMGSRPHDSTSTRRHRLLLAGLRPTSAFYRSRRSALRQASSRHRSTARPPTRPAHAAAERAGSQPPWPVRRRPARAPGHVGSLYGLVPAFARPSVSYAVRRSARPSFSKWRRMLGVSRGYKQCSVVFLGT